MPDYPLPQRVLSSAVTFARLRIRKASEAVWLTQALERLVGSGPSPAASVQQLLKTMKATWNENNACLMMKISRSQSLYTNVTWAAFVCRDLELAIGQRCWLTLIFCIIHWCLTRNGHQKTKLNLVLKLLKTNIPVIMLPIKLWKWLLSIKYYGKVWNEYPR